jgi:hypothetical protein
MKYRAARRGAAIAIALALCTGAWPARAQQAQATPPAPVADHAAPASDAQPGAPDATDDATAKVQLPGVEVQGKRNPWADADERLKKLTESLPCVGCDAKPVKPGGKLKKALDKAVDFALDQVTPQAPRDHSHEANDAAKDNAQQGQCIGAANLMQCVPANANP